MNQRRKFPHNLRTLFIRQDVGIYYFPYKRLCKNYGVSLRGLFCRYAISFFPWPPVRREITSQLRLHVNFVFFYNFNRFYLWQPHTNRSQIITFLYADIVPTNIFSKNKCWNKFTVFNTCIYMTYVPTFKTFCPRTPLTRHCELIGKVRLIFQTKKSRYVK